MNVWLFKDGENLPVQSGARRMRTWMLAEALAARGHDVTWWSSTHSHQRKDLVAGEDRVIDIAPRFRLRLLHAGSYRGNRSIARLRHHARLGAKFRREAPGLPAPDVVVAAFPTIELAYEAVSYANASRIPSIVDIRDPWPDSLAGQVPRPLRPLARLAIRALDRKARAAFAGADSLVACSQGFLDWGLRKSGRARRPGDRVFYLGSAQRPAGGPAVAATTRELVDRLAGKIVFSFVGSFGHVYRLRLVCRAAEQLEKRGLGQVHFVIAGDGAQRDAVSEAARSLGNLTAPGWLPADDADYLMARSQAGLAPIVQMPGCVPNKVFEYAAAGLPIVSSLLGETEQLLAKHGAGLTYAPGDLDAFVSIVARLATDEGLRHELARNSAAMFDREFRAERIYDEYARHVEAIAHASPA